MERSKNVAVIKAMFNWDDCGSWDSLERTMDKDKDKCSDQSLTVKKIRKKVGMTQSSLSQALGISIRAVQSYEQGWREVPTHILVQLLVLAAAYHTKGDRKTCWEIRECPPELMKTCPCCKTDGMLCWLVTGRKSAPCIEGSGDLSACMECQVVKQILE
jgi:DNA-binding transcriptional regulator YiaG